MAEHDPGLHKGVYTYVGPSPFGFVALTHPDPEIGGDAKVWVHPSNVGYYTAHGWEEVPAEDPAPAAPPRKSRPVKKES